MKRRPPNQSAKRPKKAKHAHPKKKEQGSSSGGRVLDSYPVLNKENCPYKAKSNNILVELLRDVPCKTCLVLDAASCLTSRALKKQGIKKWDIHVPNMCDDAFEVLRDSDVCTAYHCSANQFMRDCGPKYSIREFGLIYLDYCTTFDGGHGKYETNPRFDVQDLFRLNLFSPQGCVLALTLAKPRDDKTNEPQMSEVRYFLAAMQLKYGLYVVPHRKNNSYNNWTTEFYFVGKRDALLRYLKMDKSEAASSHDQKSAAYYNHSYSASTSSGSKEIISLCEESDEEEEDVEVVGLDKRQPSPAANGSANGNRTVESNVGEENYSSDEEVIDLTIGLT